MALPVAHSAVACGLTRTRDRWTLALLSLFSVLPDFDFAIVLLFDTTISESHRTWTHSLLFALVLSLLWKWLRPAGMRAVSAVTVFLVVASHAVVDLLCTADALDHGVMLFWPFSELRVGWPVLVPLYQLLAETPFSVWGIVAFTLVESMMAPLLWAMGRSVLIVKESVTVLFFSRFRQIVPEFEEQLPKSEFLFEEFSSGPGIREP
jgi:membrane-bound metal-dependent hydrolase YbcI (DUF457 family)